VFSGKQFNAYVAWEIRVRADFVKAFIDADFILVDGAPDDAPTVSDAGVAYFEAFFSVLFFQAIFDSIPDRLDFLDRQLDKVTQFKGLISRVKWITFHIKNPRF